MVRNQSRSEYTEPNLKDYSLTLIDIEVKGFAKEDLKQPISYSSKLRRFINVADVVKVGITKEELKRPVSYNPEKRSFIYPSEVIAGNESIIRLENLSDVDLRKLILVRLWTAPDIKGGPMSSPNLSPDMIATEIAQNSSFGQSFSAADTSNLREYQLDLMHKTQQVLYESK